MRHSRPEINTQQMACHVYGCEWFPMFWTLIVADGSIRRLINSCRCPVRRLGQCAAPDAHVSHAGVDATALALPQSGVPHGRADAPFDRTLRPRRVLGGRVVVELAICFRFRSVQPIPVIGALAEPGRLASEPCKNGWTERDAVRQAESCAPTAPCIRLGSCIGATRRLRWTIRARQRCGLMSNHLPRPAAL